MYLLKEASRKAKPLARLAAASALLVVLIAGANVPLASAADAKNYPGSMCVRFDGPDTDFLSFSRIGNSSTTDTIFLDCIAINDVPGKGIQSAWVRVIDRNDGQNVKCRLAIVSFNSDGDVIQLFSPQFESEGASVAVQVLSFGRIDSVPNAHYFFGCEIPPRFDGNFSYIVTYNVAE